MKNPNIKGIFTTTARALGYDPSPNLIHSITTDQQHIASMLERQATLVEKGAMAPHELVGQVIEILNQDDICFSDIPKTRISK